MTGFYISIYNGLLQGHRKRMGAAVWEFMWLIDKVTAITEDGTGSVLNGKPIKLKLLAKDLESAESTISENLSKLQQEGYINTVNTGHGLIITVNKAKKKWSSKEKPEFGKAESRIRKTLNQDSEKDKPLYIDKTDNKTINNITNVMEKNSDDVAVLEEKKIYGNPEINELQRFFLELNEYPKEDCTQNESRRYWKLLLNESRSGVDGVKWLIDAAHKDEFLKNNITSSKDLYYKRIKIIARMRGNKPKIAVMPKNI